MVTIVEGYNEINVIMVRVTAFTSVGGVVSDSATGQVLWGTLVELMDMNRNILETDTTGSTGNYLFQAITPGDYLLRFSMAGYVTQEV
ncbi:MAG: carboxypeptidase-like regulatory domain-containing protein [Dehalococcoidales bacterium]|nr:carboxypeptidase-like regulatory domain-containing protein [Dehalococcoidales bacterium]